MSKKDLVIFGEKDIAELAKFYFDEDSNYCVKAFCVHDKYRENKELLGLEVMDYSQAIKKFSPSTTDFFVALAYTNMNELRANICQEIEQNNFKLASYVSSKLTRFKDFNCGPNCFLLEDNTIQPFVKLGRNITLWSGNHIGHHSTLEDNVFITSHVVVSGGVNVGRNSFIGVNSTIHDHLSIAPYSLIAAGSLVNKDTEENSVYFGSPAKKKEGRKSTDIKI